MFPSMTSLMETLCDEAQETFSKLESDESFSKSLTKLLQSVNSIQASDLKINLNTIWDDKAAENPAPIVSIPIFLNHKMSMNVFVLQDGTHIPIHDHPGMYGILKVIHGTLGITAYSPVLNTSDESECMANDSETEEENLDSLIPVNLHMSKNVTINDEACLLTPIVGNYHEIRAVNGTAAMFYILAPPYSSSERLCCLYSLLETKGKDSPNKMWLCEKPDVPNYWYKLKFIEYTKHKVST